MGGDGSITENVFETLYTKLMYSFLFKLNFKYVLKVLIGPQHRWTLVLAEQIINDNLGWYREWVRMGEEYDCSLGEGVQNERTGKIILMKHVEEIEGRFQTDCMDVIRRSQFHSLYLTLKLDVFVDNVYLRDEFTTYEKGIIFKTGGQ